MAELLSTLSIVFFVVAGVAFVLAVFLWFFFRIPKVVSDLSGRTAKKSIARMRNAQPSRERDRRGTAGKTSEPKTERQSAEQKPVRPRPVTASQPKPAPQKPVSPKPAPQKPQDEPATAVLQEAETTPLSEERTAPIPDARPLTSLLTDEAAETAPLAVGTAPLPPKGLPDAGATASLTDDSATRPLPETRVRRDPRLRMLDEIILIHTDEVIE